jgi:5-formyltetrahydrofolate cyclo-ligase
VSSGQRREWDRAIQRQLLAQPFYLNARWLHCYLSLQNEVATEPVVRAALAGNKQVVVPVVEPEERQLLLAQIEDYDRDLAPGYRGILEPPTGARRLIEAGRIDLYLIPGVAFDPRGYRLGRGLGYYDRCLAGVKDAATVCALAYELQVVDQLPVEKHDIRVDLIVTERRVIEVKGKG